MDGRVELVRAVAWAPAERGKARLVLEAARPFHLTCNVGPMSPATGEQSRALTYEALVTNYLKVSG